MSFADLSTQLYCTNSVYFVDGVFPKLHSHFSNFRFRNIFTNGGQLNIKSSDRILGVSKFGWKEGHAEITLIISHSGEIKAELEKTDKQLRSLNLPDCIFTKIQGILHTLRADC